MARGLGARQCRMSPADGFHLVLTVLEDLLEMLIPLSYALDVSLLQHPWLSLQAQLSVFCFLWRLGKVTAQRQ